MLEQLDDCQGCRSSAAATVVLPHPSLPWWRSRRTVSVRAARVMATSAKRFGPVGGAKRAVPRNIQGVRLASQRHGTVGCAHHGLWAGSRRCHQLRLGGVDLCARAIDRHQLPGSGHAAKFDGAPIIEVGARADDEIANGTRDQNFAGTGLTGMRAAMWTAMPPMSLSISSHSPVWIPARIWIANVSASAPRDSAQRMAWVGPSKVTR